MVPCDRKDPEMECRIKPTRLVMSASVVALMLIASSMARAEEDKEKGSITGTISVSGVRSPENVLVHIETVAGEWKPLEKPAHMDQVRLVFTPPVLPVVKGSTVEFLNSDPILHNVFWPKGKGYAARNLGTWGKGSAKRYKFDQLGEIVLLCNVHAEMEGHIVVLQNPFFAVVGKDGEYKIDGVPPGEYTLTTWYSKPKRLRSKSAKVTVKAGEATTQNFSLSRRR